MRLVRVELVRLLSRRAVALLLLAATLLVALVAFETVWRTRPPSVQELAEARLLAHQETLDAGYRRDFADCRRSPDDYFGRPAGAAACTRAIVPTTSSFLDRGALSVDWARAGSGLTVVVLVSAVMIGVGATYAGADWASGSMARQLLAVPQRRRVWTAKALAVLVGCAAASAILLAAFWLALGLVARARGLEPTTQVEALVAASAGRGVLFAALAGLGAFAVTMLTRSSLVTVALLFAGTVGGEVALTVLPLRHPALWGVTSNAFAWLRDGVQQYDGGLACRTAPALCDPHYTVSLVHGGVYLGVLLLLAAAVSLLSFHARDVE